MCISKLNPKFRKQINELLALTSVAAYMQLIVVRFRIDSLSSGCKGQTNPKLTDLKYSM